MPWFDVRIVLSYFIFEKSSIIAKISFCHHYNYKTHIFENIFLVIKSNLNNELCKLLWIVLYLYYHGYFNVWEISLLFFTGGTPYPENKSREVIKLLKEKYRMHQPEHCSDKLWASSFLFYSVQMNISDRRFQWRIPGVRWVLTYPLKYTAALFQF